MKRILKSFFGCISLTLLVQPMAFGMKNLNERKALTETELEALTGGDLSMDRGTGGQFEIRGRWPRKCERGAVFKVYSESRKHRVEVMVSDLCAQLVKVKNLQSQPKIMVPLAVSLTISDYQDGDIIFLGRSAQALDLSMPSESWNKTLGVNGTLDENSNISQNSLNAQKEKELNDFLYFRRCQNATGSSREGDNCGSVNGWDLGAQIPLGESTQLRGTTILEQKQAVGNQFSVDGKPGFQMEFIYNFGEQ